MITSINEFKKHINNINEYYDRYRNVKGTIYFRNFTQKILWDTEMSGQISDGYWENSSGDSWAFWTTLNTDVDAKNPRVEANMAPSRTNFNLSSKELLEIVGDRMIAMAKMSKITKDEKLIDAAESLEGINDFEQFHKIKNSDSEYRSKYLKVIDDDLFNKWLAVPYNMTKLVADLNDMKDIMKTVGDTFNRSVSKSKKRIETGFDKKDTDRVIGIINKADGNDEKAKQLAQSMANKIKDGYKAIRRGKAAEDENYDLVAQVFFDRAKELGVMESKINENIEDMLHINLLDRYNKNNMINDHRQKFEEFKHKIKGFKETSGDLKIGDIIELTGGYNSDIRYTTEILGFDEDDEIYLLWDAYWAPIRNDEKRVIKVIN